MKTQQLIYSEANGWKQLNDSSNCTDAGLVLVFGHRNQLNKPGVLDELRFRYPEAEIVGCSTAGEIAGDLVTDGGIVATAVKFEKAVIKVFALPIDEMSESYAIGLKLGSLIPHEDLRHILTLSEGLNINGSDLTQGINAAVGGLIPVTGGLAGDDADFIETLIVHNSTIQKNLVLAIAFYGAGLEVGYGSMGGWESFGVDRLVTRSEANILFELDGQPALSLYKQYLGEYARNLPASGLLFPLSLRFRDSSVNLVRTILSVNEHNGSMVFAGNIPQGEYVRLMKASFNNLIDGAGDAAALSVQRLGMSDPELAILISCIGRKLVLRQRVEEEIEIVNETLGQQCTFTGFYSYGEICPVGQHNNRCELHNQTMTITLFKEV